MNMPLNVAASLLRQQVANTLLRARKLPPGPYKNDLRQLGANLLRLYKMRLGECREGLKERADDIRAFDYVGSC